MQTKSQLITKETLPIWIKTATMDELSYTIGRYCGKQNSILRSKKFAVSDDYLRQALEKEMLDRTLDEILSSDE